MLILLPPSAGKTQPESGSPTYIKALIGGSDLESYRKELMTALAQISSKPEAFDVLGVSERMHEEVINNTQLDTIPADIASKVYSGVLFKAADLDGLDKEGKKKARDSVRIMSALYGVLSPCDRISAYRLDANVTLPDLGTVKKYWSGKLNSVLDPLAENSVIIDCRSGAYQSFYTPEVECDVFRVGAVQEKDGKRKTVSHWAKYHRGVFTKYLLTEANALPNNLKEVEACANDFVASEQDVKGVEISTEKYGYSLSFIVR